MIWPSKATITNMTQEEKGFSPVKNAERIQSLDVMSGLFCLAKRKEELKPVQDIANVDSSKPIKAIMLNKIIFSATRNRTL